jgi:hypothetical protein
MEALKDVNSHLYIIAYKFTRGRAFSAKSLFKIIITLLFIKYQVAIFRRFFEVSLLF